MLRIFIKLWFLFTVGKCLSRKAVYKWVEKVAYDARPGAEVAETTVKETAVGFDALVKRRNKGTNVGGGYVEK
jgi:hypothetical protein